MTVVDFPGHRLDRAARLGATRTLPVGDDLAGRVEAAIGAGGADVVIEASGAPGQLDTAIRLVRDGGTILQVGLPAKRAGGGRARARDAGDHRAHDPRARLRRGPRARRCGSSPTTPLAAELLDSVRPLDDLAGQLQRLADGPARGQGPVRPANCRRHRYEGSGLPRRTTTSASRTSPSPSAPGPGEVLLRPFWCGICGTDLHEYAMGPIVIPAEPHPLNGSVLPQILGHEFSGRGRGGRRRRHRAAGEGQRVSVMPLLFVRHLLLLPPRAEPPLRPDGLRRAQLRLGRHRRARRRARQPRDSAARMRCPTCRARSSSRPRSPPTASTPRRCGRATRCSSRAPGPIGALAALYAAVARRRASRSPR